MTINWTDNLKTGIDAIDYQHQLLFETINKLDGAKTDKITFLEVVIELQIYISEHFNTEEKFMNSSGYSDYYPHKESHEKFIIEYKEKFKQMLQDESIEIAPELIIFVENWLSAHYTNEDVKMADYLNKYYTNINKINI